MSVEFGCVSSRRIEEGTNLAHGILLHVVFESPQLQMKDRWESLEYHTLLCVLQSITLGHILVFAFQGLDLNVVLERVMQCPHSLDRELDVVKVLHHRGLVGHVDTFDVVLHFAHEELRDSAFRWRAL
jgi:hypothetical protein